MSISPTSKPGAVPTAIRWQNAWRFGSVCLAIAVALLALVFKDLPEIRFLWPFLILFGFYSALLFFGCPRIPKLIPFARVATGFFDVPFWLAWWWFSIQLAQRETTPSALPSLCGVIVVGASALSLKAWEITVVLLIAIPGYMVVLSRTDMNEPLLVFVSAGLFFAAQAGRYVQRKFIPLLDSSEKSAGSIVDAKAAFDLAGKTTPSRQSGVWESLAPEEIDPLFPDHEVCELIGRGGMGAVYRAVQVKLKRDVAIKVMPPEIAEADPSFARRFRREAEAMAALHHPNIVAIHDFGETDAEHFFIVMEFVDGSNLHQLIRSGGLSVRRGLEIVIDVCQALEVAHDRGIVHRDIKPANILTGKDGQVKVADFGLAKAMQGDPSQIGFTLTEVGAVLGTPSHCAPEQLDGGAVDHRADIYSLGIVLYEVLTGQIPRGAFSLPSEQVGTDPRIDHIIRTAMDPMPDHRYQRVADFRGEVEAVLDDTVR